MLKSSTDKTSSKPIKSARNRKAKFNFDHCWLYDGNKQEKEENKQATTQTKEDAIRLPLTDSKVKGADAGLSPYSQSGANT